MDNPAYIVIVVIATIILLVILFFICCKLRKQRGRTQTLQEILADIVSMTRPILAELRSYVSPPLLVHNMMMAVFMLLGEDRKLVSNWSNILILLKGSRENSLVSRICHFTVADDKVLKEVRKLIKDMTFEDVHSAGKNGSYLFRWVLKVCNINDSVSVTDL